MTVVTSFVGLDYARIGFRLWNHSSALIVWCNSNEEIYANGRELRNLYSLARVSMPMDADFHQAQGQIYFKFWTLL